MEVAIESEIAPLKTDADGVVRVRESRVILDTIVAVFQQGATAEGIGDRLSISILKLAGKSL
ncbi:hypothetical protein H6S82_24510 [Planktothrix sp. FACHB-1355]|uniref:Uncharacterized protein n=1 Tax=Aerosakkonema funiforme FACHB-1375 TaxID=2949571 RepID=A0A926ZFC0_9CYAN|nr:MULTISPECIES: hypothetical protein [Oscillatoriales]MBD2180534.1 hypothetical protein [Aerosakkonema funiforme FACHB-1375]MBD3561985.1 hypothetical protein [Planktothrix sp. FACHB-1355]